MLIEKKQWIYAERPKDGKMPKTVREQNCVFNIIN